MMRPEDRAALARLAALDSGPIPFGAWLVAEVEGELWAAPRRWRAGARVADPFRPTADLVELLEMRAAQMRARLRGWTVACAQRYGGWRGEEQP